MFTIMEADSIYVKLPQTEFTWINGIYIAKYKSDFFLSTDANININFEPAVPYCM